MAYQRFYRYSLGFIAFTAIGVIGHGRGVCGDLKSARHDLGEAAGEKEAKRGFVTRSFNDEMGGVHHYLIFLPHGYRPGDRPPVLLFLNGLGENGDDGIKQISNNFGQPVWEMRPFFPFLAVMPQCRKGGSWTPGGPEVQSVLQILDSVVGEFGADEERVFLTGVSAGGGGVWSVVVKRFRRAAPLLKTIIAALQEEGWSRRIDDPLPQSNGVDPKRRLHDAIKKLNACQSSKRIHFYGDGTGAGICWQLAQQPANDT